MRARQQTLMWLRACLLVCLSASSHTPLAPPYWMEPLLFKGIWIQDEKLMLSALGFENSCSIEFWTVYFLNSLS